VAKIVITEFMDEDAVAELRRSFDVVYDPVLVDRPADLLAQAINAQALIVRNRTQISAELLSHLPALRVVGRLGVGLDNIDLNATQARNITVIPATGANALAVAEYVITSALILLRGAFLSSAQVAQGLWPRAALSSGLEISTKQLGLIGFGSIGQLTAKLAQALGVSVVAYDPNIPAENPIWVESNVQAVSFESLLTSSDIISLHVPLVKATHHLISEKEFSLIKSTAVLINTARGGIVDENALAAALTSGRLAGAALDVFEQEPLPANSVLAGVPNLLLTPHIAGVSRESNQRVSHLIATKVAEALLSEQSELGL
jgi:Phosphoglycerate dehydrogenase and related dehydrogenases